MIMKYDIKKEYIRFMDRRRALCDAESKISKGYANELAQDASKEKVKREARALTRQYKVQMERCRRLCQLAAAYAQEADYARMLWQDGLVIHVKPTFNDPLEAAARKLGIVFPNVNEEVCDEVDGDCEQA